MKDLTTLINIVLLENHNFDNYEHKPIDPEGNEKEIEL